MINMFKILFSAPHRPFFLLGTLAMVGLMGWWLLQLAHPAAVEIAPGWVHAWLMVYGVFTPFICGFLFTAMPRWVSARPPSRATWLTVWWLMAVGLPLTVAGTYLGLAVSGTGWSLLSLAWLGIIAAALGIWIRGDSGAVHTLPTILALLLGGAGVAAIVAWHVGGNWQWSFLGMRMGLWGFLLILYITVSHRMLPFFASRVLSGYEIYRPGWMLGVLVAGSAAHMLLDLKHAYHLLWPVDLVMLGIVCWLAWRWQFWRSRGIPLLSSLFLAWFALAVGLTLSIVQSAWLATTGEFILGRAPQHMIGIGFFGGMLIAMATRVTLGHSGRPLAMDRLTWWTLVSIEVAAVSRVLAEVAALSDFSRALLITSAVIWVVAAGIWASRYAPIYLRPRADNAPG